MVIDSDISKPFKASILTLPHCSRTCMLSYSSFKRDHSNLGGEFVLTLSLVLNGGRRVKIA